MTDNSNNSQPKNDNSYAHFLKEQGNYVVTVEGIDWCEYQGFMVPAYLPHCIPEISRDVAKEALRISGRPFVRWHTDFRNIDNSQWWCVVKRGPWELNNIKDGSKRYKVRKGKRLFTTRPLKPKEIVQLCPRLTLLATSRYRTETSLETPEYFNKTIQASEKVPGVVEYIGCFYEDTLASFSENYVQNNGVFCNIIRHDPLFLKKNSSYALIDGMLDYYLNKKKCDYLTNGWRNIYHDTEFHNHIISVFGYTIEYCFLNVEYSKAFATAICLAYPFNNIVQYLADRLKSHSVEKVAAVLKQEFIAKACSTQYKKKS